MNVIGWRRLMGAKAVNRFLSRLAGEEAPGCTHRCDLTGPDAGAAHFPNPEKNKEKRPAN
jgi:hypothetical protein